MSSIVFLSHTARSSDFRVGSHHLSRALAIQGHQVAHISTPFSLSHAILRPEQHARRRAALKGAVLVDGVTDYIPVPLVPANLHWSRRQTQRALNAVGIPSPEYVFIDQPLFSANHFDTATVIFRPTDVFPTEALQRAALKQASIVDGVVATSPKVLLSVMKDSQRPSRVLENGVDYARFAAARTDEKKYDFVYVGALDFRFDFGILAAAANALPSSRFEIFGPVPRNLPSGFPSNVNFPGSLAYASAPRAIAAGRVGLMPFTDNASNAARSPMKLYEYLAAGVPVVAPTSVADRAVGIGGVFPFAAGDAHSFISSLSDSLVRGAPIVNDDDEAARNKDWSVVAAQLLSFAKQIRDGKGRTSAHHDDH